MSSVPADSDYSVYLRRAQEVETLAAGMKFEADREALLKIARQWRDLAEGAMRRAGVAPEEA